MKTYTFVFKDAKQKSLLYLVLRENGKREKISLQLKEDPATFDKERYLEKPCARDPRSPSAVDPRKQV